MKWLSQTALIFLILIISAAGESVATPKPINLKGPVTPYYTLQVYPYPPRPGEKLFVKLTTPLQVEKATAVFGWFRGRYRVPLHYERSAWRGVLSVPRHAPPGWHLVFVYLKGQPRDDAKDTSPVAWAKSLFAKLNPFGPQKRMLHGKIWVEVASPDILSSSGNLTSEAIAHQAITPEIASFVTPPIPSEEELSKTEAPGISRAREEAGALVGGGRAVVGGVDGPVRSVASGMPGAKELFYPSKDSSASLPTLPGAKFPELPNLKITGSKVINFGSKSLEGSREGFTPGVTREEILHLNVKGNLVEEIDVDADLLNSSTLGSIITGERKDKVNVHLKRHELDALLGDIDLTLNDVEFSKLSKKASGVRISGSYPRLGFTLFSASPQGQSKIFKSYGDGTTGPYRLGASPVVLESERVDLDHTPQKRGEDYTIDYNAGTITFRKQPIQGTQVIEVSFDQRQTSYPHQTVGGRVTGKPLSWLSVGASYINDSDLPDPNAIRAASGTNSSTLPNPESHHVAGFDTSLMLGEYGLLSGELAFSEKNRNTLGDGSSEMGRAGKVTLETQYGPWSLKSHLRRVSPLFLPISDPSAKQDLTEHAATFGFQPFQALRLESGYSKEKYKIGGSPYDTESRMNRVRLEPKGLPSLTYSDLQSQELSDPVSAARIERRTNKKEGELRYRFPLVELSLSEGEEKREDQTPTLATTLFKTVRAGGTFLGIDPFTLSTNLELKETELPDGRRPTTRTYATNISVSPFREYTLVGSIHHVDDSLQGISSATQVSYRAEPTPWFRSEGNWNMSSLSETLGSTREAVLKQVGSIQLETRLPMWGGRFRYYFHPELKRAEHQGATLTDNSSHQFDVNLSPIPEVGFGFTQKINQVTNVDPTDYPKLTRLQNSGASTTRILSLRLAPLRMISMELTQTLDDSIEDRLRAGSVQSGGATYDRTESDNNKVEAAIRTTLNDLLSIDSRYINERGVQTGGNTSASPGRDELRQTGSFKLLLDVTKGWTLQGGTSFSQTTNYRSTENRDSFVVTPTTGFTFRDGNRTWVDFDYSYSKSTYGTPQESSTYGLRAKYELVDAVSLTFRGEQQVGNMPNLFRTNDYAGSVEIKL